MITCIHCHNQLHAGKDEAGRPILGLTDDQKLMDLIQRATEHLKLCSRDELQKAVLLGSNLTTLLIVCSFESDDPYWCQKRMTAAAQLNAFTRRVLTDEDIESLVRKTFTRSALFHGYVEIEDIVAFTRQMRDYLHYTDVLRPPAAASPDPQRPAA